jgi:hypothetical protein
MRLIMPWNNLGCLAVDTKKVYADLFVKPYFGLYVHVKASGKRTWYSVTRLRKLKSKG